MMMNGDDFDDDDDHEITVIISHCLHIPQYFIVGGVGVGSLKGRPHRNIIITIKLDSINAIRNRVFNRCLSSLHHAKLIKCHF